MPVKKDEYKKHIAAILDEKIFKLLTNPFAFEKMKWAEKRALLFEICGAVDDQEVVASDEKFKSLIGEDIERLKRSTAALKKQLREDIKNIPPRIDELTSSLVEIDIVVANESLIAKKKQIADIDKQLEVGSESVEELRKKRQKCMDLEGKYAHMATKLNSDTYKVLNDLKTKAQEIEYSISRDQTVIKSKTVGIDNYKAEMMRLEEEMAHLRSQYTQEMKAVFDLGFNHTCPTCKQMLPQEMIESKEQELKHNFDEEKAKKLSSIQNQGKSKGQAVEDFNAHIKTLEDEIQKAAKEIDIKANELNELKAQIAANEQISAPEPTEEMKALAIELDVLKKEIEEYVSFDATELKLVREEMTKELDSIKQLVTQYDLQQKTVVRIDELKANHRDLNQQLADVEKQDFIIEAFTRTKINMLNERINSRFKLVRFKLFNELVNGGLEECCESLIEGVPFSDANNASKINAGLDIINTLTDYYGITAPIFIDNAEGVNELIDTSSQMIRLVVSKDQELKITQ